MLRAICILTVFVAGVVHSAPVEITSGSESAFRAFVGKRVHLCGRYFGRDNRGAYVATGRATVHLAGYPLRRFPESQEICVTGVLHYWPKPQFNDGCLPNESFFYFTVEDHSLRVIPRQR